jgi:hypothetical protein
MKETCFKSKPSKYIDKENIIQKKEGAWNLTLKTAKLNKIYKKAFQVDSYQNHLLTEEGFGSPR